MYGVRNQKTHKTYHKDNTIIGISIVVSTMSGSYGAVAAGCSRHKMTLSLLFAFANRWLTTITAASTAFAIYPLYLTVFYGICVAIITDGYV